MAAFGFMIIQTLVTDIEPDHKVKDAMNEINSAQRYRYTCTDSFLLPKESRPVQICLNLQDLGEKRREGEGGGNVKYSCPCKRS